MCLDLEKPEKYIFCKQDLDKNDDEIAKIEEKAQAQKSNRHNQKN